MKVLLINRARNSGGFSIDELFRNIYLELRKDINVSNYFMDADISLIENVYKLFTLKADIYHITGDVYYLALFLPKKKTIVTVHDIGHYLYGLSGLKKYVYKFFWHTIPFRKSTFITAVSDQTRSNILAHFKLDPDKVIVIPNCYPQHFKPVPKDFNSSKPRILQVGTRGHKNVLRLVKALKDINCKLVLIGKLDAEILDSLIEYNIDYENHYNLTHLEVYKEYVKSDIVTFASVGEGFGMPIIEGNAVGRPVITSNISPMKDVAGHGACLVNPYNIKDIRNAIIKIIHDRRYREKLIRNGLKNIERFKPSYIAGLYMKLYSEMYRGLRQDHKL